MANEIILKTNEPIATFFLKQNSMAIQKRNAASVMRTLKNLNEKKMKNLLCSTM